MSTHDCFISYASADLALAEDLDRRLTAAGFLVWFDKARLKPGFDWHGEIEAGCDGARVILPVLTPNWKKSEWTRFETYGHDTAIPLWFSGTWDAVITGPLSRFQAHDLRAADEATWAALFAAVRAALKKPVPEKVARIAQLRYSPNPYFVGRDELLVQICEELHAGHTAALTQGHIRAITAMGGVGKTTLASEYAHRFWRLYRQIFWVDARAGYETEFAKVCDLLFPQAADRPVPPSEKAKVALAELCGRTERLLVIDNAEDESSAMAWVPKSGGCHTLITSRFSAWSAAVKSIPVFVLEPEPARALLTRRVGRVAEGADAEACDTLAKDLGYLPLALEIAAAFVEQQGEGYGFADYLRLYRAAAKDLLAEKRLGSTEYPDAVLTTWTETVKRLPPEARAILRIAAFLAATPIPLDVFVTGADKVCELAKDFGEAPPLAETDNREVRMRKAAAALKAYSMAALTGDTLQFHTLVQTVERLNAGSAEQDKAAGMAVGLLDDVFPKAAFNTWPMCARLTPHAETAAALAGDALGDSLVRLLNETAYYLDDLAQFSRAEPLYRRALTIAEANFGPDHPRVALFLTNLAGLLWRTNRLAEAEVLCRQALTIDEANLGPDHPDVATDLNNLATLLGDTNRLTEAEPLFRRALKINEAALGPNHRMVAIRLSNLATLLCATNRLAEAEPLFRRALKIMETSHGPDHPDVATTLNNLAELLRVTNRLAEAEPLIRRALKIHEASYGPDHPDVAKTLNNLAELLRATNRLAEAEPLYRRALTIVETSLGPDHPDVAIDLSNLAGLLRDTGRLAEAEPLYRRAVTIMAASYGPDHPSTVTVRENLDVLLAERKAKNGGS